MKSVILFALFIAAAVAAPLDADKNAVVVESQNNNIGTPDGYISGYQTSNGLSANEQGQIADLGTENEGLEVSGQFSYPGDDGQIYTVTYKAGRAGFQPSAPHLPKA